MTIKPTDPKRADKWQEFRARYPSGSTERMHPLSRRSRGNGERCAGQ